MDTATIPASQTSAAFGDLVRWASGLEWDAIPPAIRSRAALILADDFASMVAARDVPELEAMRKAALAMSGPAEALIHDGSGRRLDRQRAALVNGSAADWCELDGGYRLAVCHAALYCVPALLAEAEATGKTLRETLVALVAGYEVVARVARCFAFPRLVMHPHGGLATLGAAAAVARLRGVDAELFRKALDSAAALVVPGPFNHAVEGALMRNVWPGICAENGIRAVDWAAMGVHGGANALHEVFADIFGARPDPAALNRGLGESFAMQDAYHKLHACCQYAHSTVEAVLGAVASADGPIDVDTVRSLSVETHEKGRMLDNARPATSLAAKFSIQHIAAATLASGHAGATAFHSSTLADPQLDALRHKVEIAAFEPVLPSPNDRPARVAIELSDGRVLRGECLSARGGADRPFETALLLEKAAGNLAETHARLAGLAPRMVDLDPALLDMPVAELLLPG